MLLAWKWYFLCEKCIIFVIIFSHLNLNNNIIKNRILLHISQPQAMELFLLPLLPLLIVFVCFCIATKCANYIWNYFAFDQIMHTAVYVNLKQKNSCTAAVTLNNQLLCEQWRWRQRCCGGVSKQWIIPSIHHFHSFHFYFDVFGLFVSIVPV